MHSTNHAHGEGADAGRASPDRSEERIYFPAELRAKPVVECHEPLGIVQRSLPNLLCRNILPDTVDVLGSQSMLCRISVIDRLRIAADTVRRCGECGLLPEGFQLLLGYAYRAPEVQASYFETARHHVLAWHRELADPAAIEAQASRLVNPVDVAGHTAGAAVDVTIADAKGRELEMGTPFLKFEKQELIPVFAYRDIDAQIHDRRIALRTAMTNAGFAPFAGEWWHFSYGDRDWAIYYHNPTAIYGSKSSADARAILAALR